MFDMMKMLGKMKEVQGKIKEAQDKLSLLKITGESGGGMVKATVDGKHKLLSLEIDPALFKPEDQVIAQDLVVAAVNKANEEAEIQAKEEMRRQTEGLIPNIPGMDFSGFMG